MNRKNIKIQFKIIRNYFRATKFLLSSWEREGENKMVAKTNPEIRTLSSSFFYSFYIFSTTLLNDYFQRSVYLISSRKEHAVSIQLLYHMNEIIRWLCQIRGYR